MDKKLDKNTDKNTRALKLENVSVKGGIVTATCLTPRVKVGNEITLGVDENTKLECKVIKKIGTQIKARVIKVLQKQLPCNKSISMQTAQDVGTKEVAQEIAVPSSERQ